MGLDLPYSGKPHYIIALARSGAKLSIDGNIAIGLSAGEPYVPATHRPSTKARASVTPSFGPQRMLIELGSRSADQEATVLFYANLHIRP